MSKMASKIRSKVKKDLNDHLEAMTVKHGEFEGD